PAALPQHGARERKDVLWKTYIRGMEEPTDGDRFDPRMYAATLLSTSLVGRAIAEQHNPYLAREAAVTAQATGTASILPSGTAQLHRADDGTPVMAGLGALTGSQAAWIAAEATASGAADLVSITLGGLHG